jgi:hypothetical protein
MYLSSMPTTTITALNYHVTTDAAPLPDVTRHSGLARSYIAACCAAAKDAGSASGSSAVSRKLLDKLLAADAAAATTAVTGSDTGSAMDCSSTGTTSAQAAVQLLLLDLRYCPVTAFDLQWLAVTCTNTTSTTTAAAVVPRQLKLLLTEHKHLPPLRPVGQLLCCLVQLDLSCCTLDCSMLAPLSTGLSAAAALPLQTLNLSGNPLTRSFYTAATVALAAEQRVRSAAWTAGAQALGTLLSSSAALQSLNMSQCCHKPYSSEPRLVQSAGAAAVCLLSSVAAGLTARATAGATAAATVLCVARNTAPAEAWCELLPALGGTTVGSIDASGGNVPTEAAAALLRALTHQLQQRSSSSDSGTEQLAIRLSHTPFGSGSDSAVAAFISAVQELCSTVTSLQPNSITSSTTSSSGAQPRVKLDVRLCRWQQGHVALLQQAASSTSGAVELVVKEHFGVHYSLPCDFKAA